MPQPFTDPPDDACTSSTTVPDQILRLARRQFNAGEKLEMTGLARELGVNRTTLFRWVGTRERLLVEAVWAQAELAFRMAREQAPGEAPDRAVRVIVGFVDLVLSHHGFRTMLAADIELTMRLLTHRAAGFQPRLLSVVEQLLHEESDAGRLHVPMDSHELAYLVVRIIESYTYLNVLMGEEPEVARAEAALRIVLTPRVV